MSFTSLIIVAVLSSLFDLEHSISVFSVFWVPPDAFQPLLLPTSF